MSKNKPTAKTPRGGDCAPMTIGDRLLIGIVAFIVFLFVGSVALFFLAGAIAFQIINNEFWALLITVSLIGAALFAQGAKKPAEPTSIPEEEDKLCV